MVCMAQVYGAEHHCLAQTVKQISHTGYWEHIKLCLLVKTMVINHIQSSPVFFRTNSIGAPYGDTLGLIQPRSNNYAIYYFTSAYSA